MATGTQSLNTLLQRATIDDHEEILKACNASLKQSKKDPKTLHTKAVALLKLDRYDDALRVLEEGGEDLKSGASLERSYALYKNGQLSEAKDIARGISDDRGARHVEAQASYRLEIFERSARLYRDLAKTHAPIDNEENDVKINGGAADAQLEWTRQGHLVQRKRPTREDLFETAYNAACASIARGDLVQGELLLRRSRDLCNASGDLSDDEKVAELLPIQVQQVYVLNRLGKLADAQDLASQIAQKDIPDASTQHVAQNNSIAAKDSIENPYMAHRLLQNTSSIPEKDRFFTFQFDRIKENDLILDLLVSKYDGVIKSTDRTLTSNPPPSVSSHLNYISVLNAAAHAQTRLGNFGIKRILPLLEKRPLDVGLAMLIVQLYILTNNHFSAATALESLLKHLESSDVTDHQDVRFAPGLVATVVSLYGLQGRKSQITTELAKAASYWRHKSKPPKSLLQAAGLGLLDSSDPKNQATARDIFATLYQQDRTSKVATAGYIAAHALTSSSVADEVKGLTPTSRLIAGIDVSALEEAGVPQTKSNADAQAASRKRTLDEKPKPAKKRVRKSRLPKDHDPTKAPDPERWLPLKERSSYRPKGKKGRQKAAGLTQGGVEKGGEPAAAGTSGKGSEGVIKGSGPGTANKAKNKKKSKK
ncbi:Signal recognition particle subunit SRP72 [Xanthoria calcicola]